MVTQSTSTLHNPCSEPTRCTSGSYRAARIKRSHFIILNGSEQRYFRQQKAGKTGSRFRKVKCW